MKRPSLPFSPRCSPSARLDGARREPRTFTIDRSHSEVGFNVRHFFNKVHGRFTDYSGIDRVRSRTTWRPRRVEVTIKDTSIYTANERRDKHLRSEDFFWIEKHPTITFKSTKVIPGKTRSTSRSRATSRSAASPSR